MGLFSRMRGGRFKPVRLQELKRDVPNPSRGWYRIAPYDLGEGLDDVEFVMPGDEHDSLVLVRVCIGSYKDRDLDAPALERLDSILARWEEAGRGIILRVAYDVEGAGYEAEPNELAQVLTHARQVGEVAGDHARNLLVYQGLLVGSWGELHHSRFLSNKRLQQVYEVLREGLGPTVPLALRTPRQIKQVLGEAQLGDSGTMGLFNDGMMGSPTDLATFGSSPNGATLPRDSWKRDDELRLLGKLGDIAPLGGEAVGTEEYSRPRDASAYLRTTHVTYLNRTHDPATLGRWARSAGPEGWDSAFAYIGAHLGYRFVCQTARLREEGDGGLLMLTVANNGFARPFFGVEPVLVIDGAAGRREVELWGSDDLWASGSVQELSVRVSDLQAHDELALALRARGTGRVLRLANAGAQDSLPLGSWR